MKNKTYAPVHSVVFMAHNKTSSILFAARKDADQYAASFGPAAGVAITKCAVIGSQSAPQAPAVPYGVDEEAANRIALAVYDCKNDICPEPLLYAINRILATEAHPLSVEGRDALLQSAEGRSSQSQNEVQNDNSKNQVIAR